MYIFSFTQENFFKKIIDKQDMVCYYASVISQVAHLNKTRSEGDKMFEIDQRSRIPIYEQIKNQILLYIRMGIYEANEQLPSIRTVSQQTGINVNTVKRAFADLEAEGVIYSLVGRGCFVSRDAVKTTSIADKALKEIEPEIHSMKSKGVDKDSLISMIERIYSEDD